MTHKTRKPRKWNSLPSADWSIRYSRARSQAIYRGEGWELSPLDYMEIWQASGLTPGRADSFGCMTRIDNKKPWNTLNVKIVPRRQHNRKNFIENCLKLPYSESDYVA